MNAVYKIMIYRKRYLVAVKGLFKARTVTAGTHAEYILIYRACIKGCDCVLMFFVLGIELFISFFANFAVLRMHKKAPGSFCKLFLLAVIIYHAKSFVHIYICKHAEGSFG